MNLRDICNKLDHLITQEEMIFVVEEYILEKKQQKIQINLMKGAPSGMDLFQWFEYQVGMLKQAFVVSRNHYRVTKYS